MIARVVDRGFAASDGGGRFGGNVARQFERVREQRVMVGQNGVDQPNGQGAFGGHAFAGVGHFAYHAERHHFRQALQYAQIRDHADLRFLNREKRIRRAYANVAGSGQVQTATDTAALNRADDGEACLLKHIEAVH